MSKMGELSAILDQMIDCGNGMVQAALALKEFYSSTEDVKPAKKEKVAETPVEQEKEEAPSAEPEKTNKGMMVHGLKLKTGADFVD